MTLANNGRSAQPCSGRKRVGLALGGGVVRGLAHVGVLSVLEEAGIPIDFISGTSAGSIVAGCYAAGMNAAQLRQYAWQFTWWRLLRPVWPLRGLVSFAGMMRLLSRNLGDLAIEDLKLPLAIAATDIERGQPVYLRQGPLALAVQASCSVPGFVAPVQLQGRWLAEGAMSDMIPVSILRKMGADYVIGVDIFIFKLRRWLGPLGYLVSGLEIALERSGLGVEQADCTIAPELSGKTYMRFSKRDELYELGRQAALAQLPLILRDLEMEPAVPVALPPASQPAPQPALQPEPLEIPQDA
jgi:NTE family protein